MICTYCGYVPEEELLEMSYSMYTSILAEIAQRQQYEAISNMYGNGMAQNVQEIVENVNPLKDLRGGGVGKPKRLTRSTLGQLQGIKRV